MAEGVRKEKNLPERITRSIINNETQFIQSLKIFANTSIVGSQGAQSGGSTGGPGGVGNYLRKDGDIMDGVFATRPSIASIVDDEIDITKVTGTNYSSKVFLVPEGGSGPDELNYINGGSTDTQVTGAEFPGQWLIIQPIAGATITINNDASGFGDPTALPRHNIRTPDGNPVVLENEQAVLLNYDSTSGQWSFLSAVGSSGGVAADPNCFPEKDSGDQSGALTIFFNRNRFCRMRVIGDLTITFDTSEMLFGKIYFLTVETLQDPTGGHSVTYADAPFENAVTPKIYTAANRYTSIRFYAYKLDSGSAVRIFAFDEFQPFPTQFFDGYIHARLITDQTASLQPNDHIEFNQTLATDNTILVSGGSGQSRGQFSKFEIGHLYQCEVAVGIESLSQADTEFSFQWYNVTKGSFFGSQGRALTVSNTEKDSSLPIAKAFFVADALADVLEVRIKSQFGVDSLKAGDQTAEQMTYAIIKDCGVAGIESLEGNLVPALPPTPAEAVGRFKGYTIGFMGLNSAQTNFFSPGGDPGIGVQNSSTVPAMGSGKMKKLRVHISLDTGDNIDVQTYVNGVGSGFLATLEGAGVHEVDLLDREFVKDDLLTFSEGRTGSSGDINITNWLELDYEEKEFWFYGARLNGVQGTNRFSSIIDSGIHTPTSGPEGTTRNANQRSTGRAGIIKDLVYYGTAPAGTGDAIITIEVNGVAIEEREITAVHASFGIERFDNVNVEVKADDLINIKHHMRDGTQAEGIMGIRFLAF